MNLWSVALTVYMTCCIQAAKSQGETVFSISLYIGDQTNYFNFSETMFDRFYHCLRNKDHTLCDVQRNSQYEVTTVRTWSPVINSQKRDQFTCTLVVNGFVCKGVDFPTDVQDSQCLTTYNIRDNASLSQDVQFTWDSNYPVTVENYAYGITIFRLNTNIFEISGTFISKVTKTTTVATMTTTTSTIKSSGTYAAGQPPTFFSLDSSTTSRAGTDKQKNDEDGDNNNIAIIMGTTVGGVVIVAIIVIIVIILWRRKKRPSSSPTTDNNKQDDTDIYLNGVSTLSNIKPNPNSKEVTYYSNELTPPLHTIVEQNKITNETTSSKSCTANSDNNLQQKKPQISPYLNYTEAAIDSDAGLYCERNSDVNNGQKLTASTPDPSAKATYYNFLFETG